MSDTPHEISSPQTISEKDWRDELLAGKLTVDEEMKKWMREDGHSSSEVDALVTFVKVGTATTLDTYHTNVHLKIFPAGFLQNYNTPGSFKACGPHDGYICTIGALEFHLPKKIGPFVHPVTKKPGEVIVKDQGWTLEPDGNVCTFDAVQVRMTEGWGLSQQTVDYIVSKEAGVLAIRFREDTDWWHRVSGKLFPYAEFCPEPTWPDTGPRKYEELEGLEALPEPFEE